MGLPEINVNFINQGYGIIKRSMRGVVLLILRDTTKTGIEVLTSDTEIKNYSEENTDYITKALLGQPSKIIVYAIAQETKLTDILKNLQTIKFNYLAMPSATEEENTEIVTFIKSAREKDKKTVKAVLSNVKADSEGIINFTTNNIQVKKDKTYTAQEYTSRIAGLLAGLALNKSATYYILTEVENIENKEDSNSCINNGELILINDGEKCKIARAVNSLTTISKENKKTEDYKKIKIIEAMDLIRDDIKDNFENNYVGQVINDYDNKMLFIIGINNYFDEIEKQGVLLKDFDNRADIDINAQALYLKKVKKINIAEMSEQQLKTANTGSNVFAKAHVYFADAMEDLDFNIEM